MREPFLHPFFTPCPYRQWPKETAAKTIHRCFEEPRYLHPFNSPSRKKLRYVYVYVQGGEVISLIDVSRNFWFKKTRTANDSKSEFFKTGVLNLSIWASSQASITTTFRKPFRSNWKIRNLVNTRAYWFKAAGDETSEGESVHHPTTTHHQWVHSPCEWNKTTTFCATKHGMAWNVSQAPGLVHESDRW